MLVFLVEEYIKKNHMFTSIMLNNVSVFVAPAFIKSKNVIRQRQGKPRGKGWGNPDWNAIVQTIAGKSSVFFFRNMQRWRPEEQFGSLRHRL